MPSAQTAGAPGGRVRKATALGQATVAPSLPEEAPGVRSHPCRLQTKQIKKNISKAVGWTQEPGKGRAMLNKRSAASCTGEAGRPEIFPRLVLPAPTTGGSGLSGP